MASKALRSSATANNKAVGPTPPDDLWERLDAALKKIDGGKRPPDSFTFTEFAERFKMAESTGRRRIEKLIEAGLIERQGTPHNGWFVWKETKCSGQS